MVHTETEVQREGYSCLEWIPYIPLSSVPMELVEQFKDREFSYEAFKLWSVAFDKLPNVWTLGCYKDKKIIGFLYGFWNPLESEIEVKRFTILPEYFSFKGDMVKEAIKEVYKLGNKYKAKHMYFICDNFKAWLRKAPDDLHLTRYRVLEGY